LGIGFVGLVKKMDTGNKLQYVEEKFTLHRIDSVDSPKKLLALVRPLDRPTKGSKGGERIFQSQSNGANSWLLPSAASVESGRSLRQPLRAAETGGRSASVGLPPSWLESRVSTVAGTEDFAIAQPGAET
jgi:hypothetical protein